MRQRRPADPTDPGDAADLSIMGQTGTGKSLFLLAFLSRLIGHSRKVTGKSTVS